MLPKRFLSDTGIEVSVLGLGTVKFGRNEAVKYPKSFDLPSDNDINRLLTAAYDLGINFLDTAPAYGLSEARLGQLLPNKRSNWIIETKVGEQFYGGKSYFDFSKKATIQSVENSLRVLRTDYLDIVLIHSNGDDEHILQQEDVLETLLDLKRKGIIRAAGMSTKTVTGGKLAYQLGCDIVMATYNPQYIEESDLLKYAQSQKKSVVIKKAFDSGQLCSPQPENKIYSPCEIFQFILSQAAVSSVIFGTIDVKHLQENIYSVSKNG